MFRKCSIGVSLALLIVSIVPSLCESRKSNYAEEVIDLLDLRVNAGSFVDTERCYASLDQADVNADGKITADEYVTVVQLLGPPGFVDYATQFLDLPRPLRQSFNLLACICTIEANDESCCIGSNAFVSSQGTHSGETPDPDQQVYLFTVCLTTSNAIENTLGTLPPTTSPSAFPTRVTTSPTFLPSSSPITPKPITMAPITAIPTTIAPITPIPTTGAPITPKPITSAPITPKPTTMSPITPKPITMAPITPLPTTTAPITLAPITLSPTSISPNTMVPGGTPSPTISAAPISKAPVPISTLPSTIIPSTLLPTSTFFVVETKYIVAFKNGVTDDGDTDLQSAMYILASQVAAEAFPDPRSRRLFYRNRRLVVGVAATNIVGKIPLDECSASLNTNDKCQEINHSITLSIVNEDVDGVKAEFLQQLFAAIEEGRLQDSLEEVNDISNVYIVTGLQIPPTPAPQVTRGLSAGATAGIVVGSFVVLLILVALLVNRRRHQPKEDMPPTLTPVQALTSPDEVESDIRPDTTGKSKASAAALYEGGVVDTSPPLVEPGADSSSNAGSSGWSSSVGNSTLNSGSIDGMEEIPGSSLAAIGAASALASSRGKKDFGIPSVPEVTREDLDTAIEAGDWAAVGATAALLAAASDSQSHSSRSRASVSRGGSSVSSLDAARAAELDHLVDAGDWEGVVVAAAKFEAAEDSTSASASQNSVAGETSALSTGSTTLSDSPSKAAKRDEIREEVENLVRRVVPEEIDNVDEMLLQFKGREEELVETLRTMQERQVAQKARVQGQKQAKRDARQSAKGGILFPGQQTGSSSAVEGPTTPSASGINAAAATAIGVSVAAGVAAAFANSSVDDGSEQNTPVDKSPPRSDVSSTSPSAMLSMQEKRNNRSPESSGDDDEFRGNKQRTALELAIEAGDWEAVGEAAALLSDASVTSASSGEIDRFARGDTGSLSGDSTGRLQVNAERAAELDELIERGDWTGVVAVASKFGGNSPVLDAETASQISADKEKRLREEQEALAQAELWMEIAKQTKPEVSTDVAASEATDWAIARSLSALKKAETDGNLAKDDSDDSVETSRSV